MECPHEEQWGPAQTRRPRSTCRVSRHKQGHSSFSGQALKQVLMTDIEMKSQKTQACVTSHYKAQASRRQEGFRATVTLKWKDQQHEGYKYTAPCVSQQGLGYPAEQQ